ncbi:hypothetical protein MMC25_000255 [Agyrium rufum]|nr:hypothetical protein [Agyrium rufum]
MSRSRRHSQRKSLGTSIRKVSIQSASSVDDSDGGGVALTKANLETAKAVNLKSNRFATLVDLDDACHEKVLICHDRATTPPKPTTMRQDSQPPVQTMTSRIPIALPRSDFTFKFPAPSTQDMKNDSPYAPKSSTFPSSTSSHRSKSRSITGRFNDVSGRIPSLSSSPLPDSSALSTPITLSNITASSSPAVIDMPLLLGTPQRVSQDGPGPQVAVASMNSSNGDKTHKRSRGMSTSTGTPSPDCHNPNLDTIPTLNTFQSERLSISSAELHKSQMLGELRVELGSPCAHERVTISIEEDSKSRKLGSPASEFELDSSVLSSPTNGWEGFEMEFWL